MNTEKGFDLNLKFYDGELKSLRIKTLLSIKYVGCKKKETPSVNPRISLAPYPSDRKLPQNLVKTVYLFLGLPQQFSRKLPQIWG